VNKPVTAAVVHIRPTVDLASAKIRCRTNTGVDAAYGLEICRYWVEAKKHWKWHHAVCCWKYSCSI